ncbi:hypothetical protein [Dysgonomonas sp. 511]|uniref:hypothetical protein n=1 Tax=Dysgonomonas sp. 511 TaxID=2302930 RepID=UPI0013D4F6DD|nr:hypothetical protein [Dysgonomonas sp. 511]NDV77620.1 hypothetical protein [Dysgonomonas sp. 511]
MRLCLISAIFLLIPMLLWGQVEKKGEPRSGVVFYSQAPMYVAYKSGETNKGNASSTAMYVEGSMRYVDNSRIDQKGRTVLTGDFVISKSKAEDAAYKNLFINVGAEGDIAEGVVAFIGGGETVKVNSVDTERGTRQWIYYTPLTAAAADKFDAKSNPIKFPTLEVNKNYGLKYNTELWDRANVVTVDTSAAVEMNYLKINTDLTSDGSSAGKRNRLEVMTKSTGNRTVSGYLKINNTVQGVEGGSVNDAVYSQVNFAVFDNDSENIIVDSPRKVRLVGFSPPFEELPADYMFYQLLLPGVNLFLPDGKMDVDNDPRTKLQKGLGYFIASEVVTDGDQDATAGDSINITPRYSFYNSGNIEKKNRFKGNYLFNRMVFHDNLSYPYYAANNYNAQDVIARSVGVKAGFSRHTYKTFADNAVVFDAGLVTGYKNNGSGIADLSDRLFGGLTKSGWDAEKKERSKFKMSTAEKFNIQPVDITINDGFNFLGNPFMFPISLNPLLGFEPGTENNIASYATSSDGATPYDVSEYFGTGFYAVRPTGAPPADKTCLAAKYWVINNATVEYLGQDPNIAGRAKFKYEISYDYVTRGAGATVISSANIANPATYVISPMQMFGIEVSIKGATSTTMTLDPSKLVVWNQSALPKSSTTEVSDMLRDWFVVEAYDHETKVGDRAAVVFKSDARSDANDPYYDTGKGVTRTIADFERKITDTKSFTKLSDVEETLPEGLIYTKSTDNVSLLGNGVPLKTKEIPLFYDAPSTTKEITLNFYGVENMESIDGIWLTDRKLNKTMQIYPGDNYPFVSEPTDNESVVGGNRFILQFYEPDIIDDNDDGDGAMESIYSYYANSTLHIKGLNEIDLGSNVYIYDMQGRLMGRTKIDIVNSGEKTYAKPLGLGTYIVKIVGARNYTAKFTNLNR